MIDITQLNFNFSSDIRILWERFSLNIMKVSRYDYFVVIYLLEFEFLQ